MIQKIKQFFKNPKDIICFFGPIILAIILLIPVPYTVTVGGGTINIDKRILVSNSNKSSGVLKSAYVKELKGTVLTYIMGKIIPSYKVTSIKSTVLDDETEEEYEYREKNYFTSSLDNALYVAYKESNNKIEIKEEKLYINYISNEASTDLLYKDILISINGIKINSFDDISSIIESYNYGDNLEIKVLRNKKIVICHATIVNISNSKKLGISLFVDYNYILDKDVDFSFSNKESGPSGGLMIALSIYNKLTKEDITKKRIIVGTGTIDMNGKVGEIGGIKYKLNGAIKSKADIFICPKENYEEAMNIKKSNNYNIEIIGVSTFSEALKKLK